MQLTLERNQFLKALSHAQSVVEKRTTVPILAHVLLEAESGQLRLTSTDLELAIVETVSADIQKAGGTTVSAQLLHDIVRKLKDGSTIQLSLENEGSHLQITSGRSEFKLACLPPEDFPAINTTDLPHRFTVNGKDFQHLLERTRFAMSTEETRYYLNGIYLHPVEAREIRAVATDGHRLARLSLVMSQDLPHFPGVILSRKTVNEVMKILGEAEGEIEVSLSETQVSFKFNHVYLTSRLIDGSFPDYEAIIPTQNEKTLRMSMAAFSEAVDRVATVSTEKSRSVKLSINTNKIVLTASNSEFGSAVEELEVEYAAAPLELGFNARYLLDLSQQLNDVEAEFSMSDSATPVVVREVDNNDAFYLLMPMRV
ncbi:MAG: DNA polymerase III subunit beta [Candidatus Paracaedimonas acanthamoebae]|uniref:Beta sliding clamp n=1 Tax=Candidatus Paracaedimonas acanthamoebae TaxID=244581 RepID=A0A8J7TSQ6_9PROT|nr:DNA polymerase III subunit beta [Candidatus Paracaedimonas acanthamoebae]